ncbi:MAG TPA: glycoside hydrolase family 65 [Blastocatellia bacterium]|nr:glycoside hydrolase family 65 [Blastocatellia bacterium]
MKNLSRRRFLGGLAVSGALAQAESQSAGAAGSTKIDRAALINRHHPVRRSLDPLAPLSLGNGEFAFTADLTGLQTFPREYEAAMPLCTMSQWGWHTSPLGGLDPQALRLTPFDTYGRPVGYQVSSEGQSELYNWLRENPHRLHLGRIGLQLMTTSGREAQAQDLTEVEQRLDLWSGLLTSRFKFEGVPVTVRTAVHPNLDLLAVAVESKLIEEGRLAVRIAFPYGSPSMPAADWKQPDRHHSEILRRGSSGVEIHRRLDDDRYFVAIDWSLPASLTAPEAHTWILTPDRKSARLEFVAAFSPARAVRPSPTAAATFAAAAQHWQRFWNDGAAIELAESRDPRALELERRMILSQYLTAIQCAGSMPPQETGLTVNSWYGKFHLEMHWWHAAHFALWNRLPLLEKSLGWYDSILASARERARSQGYAGARWPKMSDPAGRDSPSPIGPLLIWQQPHPIFYAELCYLNQRDSRRMRVTLERYREIVFESAEFMASYAVLDRRTQRYVLGPPLIPAQENHPPRETWNPTYELSYWVFGLETAQLWRERLGLRRRPEWDRLIAQLSPLPVREGVYLAHENCPQTFTERNHDHPSMLGALGILPGPGVDPAVMRRTLDRVMKQWQWDKTWGWDFPLTALTAARLGEPRIAIDALLMTADKNRYLPNGHNYQRPNLPCYLPGNGGLLYALAMMAAGWRGAPSSHAPGFPSGGEWTVRWEGLNAAVLRKI